MKATINDIKKCDKIATERVKLSGGKFSDRFEKLVLNYSNVENSDGCLIINLKGTWRSIWDYV